MFDFEISKGYLIYHPRKGTIKSNPIKHPSYFYYCSIYNITSYCFSTVCLWCQWARDMRVTRLLSCAFQCQGMFLPQHWVLIPTRGHCVAEQPVHPRVCGCGSGHRACENRHTIIMLLSLTTAPHISPLLVWCLFLYLKFTSFLWFWRSTKSILYSLHAAWSSNGGTAKHLNPVLSMLQWPEHNTKSEWSSLLCITSANNQFLVKGGIWDVFSPKFKFQIYQLINSKCRQKL